MARYVVIQWDFYYPAGGLSDIRATFDTEKEAEEWLSEQMQYDVNEVVDLQKELIEVPPGEYDSYA